MPGVQDWCMIPKEEPPDYQEGYSNGGVSHFSFKKDSFNQDSFNRIV
jgi:hypothetical protein